MILWGAFQKQSKMMPLRAAQQIPFPWHQVAMPGEDSGRCKSLAFNFTRYEAPCVIRTLLFFLFLSTGLQAAALKVVALHPLLADLARQVGGDRVEVIDLLGKSGDPHHFQPTAKDLEKAQGARLYLAAGKGLENYLTSLQQIIGTQAEILEVGKTLPSIQGSCDDDDDNEDHDHDAHTEDPHWWHSVDAFMRATQIVADDFSKLDPEGAAEYRAHAASYRARLEGLQRWIRVQLLVIPKESRQLATAHAAFGYFCRDYGFEPIPLQGLNREQSLNPESLAGLINELKQKKVRAIFPEKESNPKVIQALTQDTGIRQGEPLTADGTGVSSYEEMMKTNVLIIRSALDNKP
jgi:zinc/manganese transport system substrate-binding protein